MFRSSSIEFRKLTDEFLEQERHSIPDVNLPIAETWVVEQGKQVIG